GLAPCQGSLAVLRNVSGVFRFTCASSYCARLAFFCSPTWCIQGIRHLGFAGNVLKTNKK
ncbi:MAG: hypothetical protein LBC37_04340, partial [Zoogloeaceae bacterium]|nr:hypothetical protein [Zoogloeaceae bacterium]